MLSQTWFYLCGGLLLLLLVLAYAFWLAHSHWRQWRAQLQQQQQQLLQEIHTMNQAAVGMGRRVHWLEKALRQVNERYDEAQRQVANENKSFLTANRLLEQGASIEQIMASCQLTRAEAELLRNLNPSSEREA